VSQSERTKIVAWVATDVLPHESDVRAWLCRAFNPADLEDVIQEAYCRIAGLGSVRHIQNGRAYFFATARSVVLEHVRRAKVVNIETVADLDEIAGASDAPSPERVISGRRELARVRALIDGLPERCREIFALRKIEGKSQREVAELLALPEHTVENEIVKGMRIILAAIASSDHVSSNSVFTAGRNWGQDAKRDQ
jgi:RNA polymerase sigma factor (sigma-70 family)